MEAAHLVFRSFHVKIISPARKIFDNGHVRFSLLQMLRPFFRDNLLLLVFYKFISFIIFIFSFSPQKYMVYVYVLHAKD